MKPEGIIADVVSAIDGAVARLKEGQFLTFITVDGEEAVFTRYELKSTDSVTLLYRYGGTGGLEADEAESEYATTITSYDGPIRVTSSRISGRDEDDETFSLLLNPLR